ncbi:MULTISPECIES: cache domain-containing sensor histidine kinase [Paenibacillus]|uniref:HAMP domain-containing protein n=1 Tax=Paenibacillus odorifer TaxID=189426 RepID=A0ABX3H696_9BACL|nr:histidine kinase [Paenibacillus odorifer]OMD45962.1 hypothetical protein BSK51_27835 [Paenibacillus odorifer]
MARYSLKQVLKKVVPSSLKYKLFVAYFLLLLIPLSSINLYNFYTAEEKMWLKNSEQSQSSLEKIRQELEDYMGIAAKTMILIEQDPSTEQRLKHPEQYTYLERRDEIEALLNGFMISLFLSAPPVFYTISDLKDNVFLTYSPLNNNNQSKTMMAMYSEMLSNNETYRWQREANYVNRDYTTSLDILSLYSVLKDKSLNPYAIVRIGIDYRQWISKMKKNSTQGEHYLIMDKNGEIILTTGSSDQVNGAQLFEKMKTITSTKIMDKQFAYHYSYVPKLEWYLVRMVPLDTLFAETNQLKRSFFWTFTILTVLFVMVTFFISSSVSRPLRELQLKMRQLAKTNLKTRLDEERFDGEILTLAQSFNSMVVEIESLISKLKIEERQKEAVRFQVLLSQMNPHFLLNTLNTIKSMSVIPEEQHKVHEVCIALGRILETSLNTDVDMIYLEEEMSMIQAYFLIHQQRFGSHIQIKYECESDLNHTLVPKFSIQPLVENAITHAFQTIAEPVITVRASKQEQNLVIEVSDNGMGIEKAGAIKSLRRRKGISIDNIKERLQLLFKDKAKFSMVSSEQGTTVQLTIPYLLSEPYRKGEK